MAFYVSGQFLTEDYYVANKLMKGFIGTANIDTNSRLCMASSVAGHKRAFGADIVPGCYDDLDEADLLVLVGSNTAWCHPVLYQRMVANRQQRGARMVVIDPRRTATTELPICTCRFEPGTDGAVQRPAGDLADHGAVDHAYVVRTPTASTRRSRAQESRGSIGATALATAASPSADVAAFFQMFAGTRGSSRSIRRASTSRRRAPTRSTPSSTATSPPAGSASRARRRFRSPASPMRWAAARSAVSPTSWPRTWTFTRPDVDRVRRFWKAPRIATQKGLKAVADVRPHPRGEIKALWVMATNPAVSLPDADAVRERWGSSNCSWCRRT